MDDDNFNVDDFKPLELLKIVNRDLKQLKYDFEKLRLKLESNPEQEKMKKQIDDLNIRFAVAEERHKIEKESDKRWMYLIIFIIGVINFLIAMADKL